MAGIQSRTTQPASAGNVKYSTSRMKETVREQLAYAARTDRCFWNIDAIPLMLDASRKISISGTA